MRTHGAKFFLQDGSPCHTSKHIMKKLKEMDDEFRVLNWPGSSPDLNPIENSWFFMKHKLNAEKFEMTSLPKADLCPQEVMVADLPQQYFVTLAHSMPKRLKTVQDN